MESGTFPVSLGGLSLPWKSSGNQAFPPAFWSSEGAAQELCSRDRELATEGSGELVCQASVAPLTLALPPPLLQHLHKWLCQSETSLGT